MLLMWTLLIGQFIHQVGGEGRGWGKGYRLEDRYFSQLQVSLYIKVYNNMA